MGEVVSFHLRLNGACKLGKKQEKENWRWNSSRRW
jgi:hypothetical protein